MSKFAWVTLTTNDTYSLGALVLGHSLRRAGTAYELAVLVTPSVSEAMRDRLKAVYNVVQEVNVLDSQDAANLALLSRPELGVTFTKLNCWRLVQFEKCVFLDADTLVLQNCDELFEREELSAAPDVSWPDCFNSGVFVFTPSVETFGKIVDFAVKNGSFDGGDQGVLNQFFSDWATADIKKRLPFIYNVTAYASYCYLPAFKQFRDKIKILHFAGKQKPWLIPFNSETKTPNTPSEYAHAQDLIQLWWNIFCDNVHQLLTDNMQSQGTALSDKQFNEECLCLKMTQPTSTSHARVNAPRNEAQNKQQEQKQQQHQHEQGQYQHGHQHHGQPVMPVQVKEYRDPWTDYYKNLDKKVNQRAEAKPEHTVANTKKKAQSQANKANVEQSIVTMPKPTHTAQTRTKDKSTDVNSNVLGARKSNPAKPTEHNNLPHHQTQLQSQTQPQSQSQPQTQTQTQHHHHQHQHHHHRRSHLRLRLQTVQNTAKPVNQTAVPAKAQTQAEVQVQVKVQSQEQVADKHEAGLAGALSQVRLGEQRSPEQVEYENLMRRQCWESGQIDYSGRDSFANIWAKISQTLDTKPAKDADKSDALPLSHNQMLTQTPVELPPPAVILPTTVLKPQPTSSSVSTSTSISTSTSTSNPTSISAASSSSNANAIASPQPATNIAKPQLTEEAVAESATPATRTTNKAPTNPPKSVVQLQPTRTPVQQQGSNPSPTQSTAAQHIVQSPKSGNASNSSSKANRQRALQLLTSADIEDGKVEYDRATGASTQYKLIEGGYEMIITTPQPNGTVKTQVKTFWDPKPVSQEDLAKEQANKKIIKQRLGKEVRIDKNTTMLTRAIEGGYEEVYTTINEDGTRSMRTKTFYDSVPAEVNDNTKTTTNKTKKNITRKSSVDSTDSTESSRRIVQKKNIVQNVNDQKSNYREDTTIETQTRVTQNIEITENNRTVRKNSLQEQNTRAITSSTNDGTKKKKKTKTSAPPPPADFVQNETTTVASKRVPGGVEYTYSTQLESGKTITTSKTVYEEEEVELTEEEIKQYKKALKDAEKHKNVTTTKKLKSESGTKKVVPSENPGDVTTVETIKIEGGTEYHYTTVTAEGIVKKATKTVYDPVPSNKTNPDDTDEEEIIEEYEEEIIEPGEKNVRTIETIKQLPKKFEEEVTIVHEKKEKKVKKSMVISQ